MPPAPLIIACTIRFYSQRKKVSVHGLDTFCLSAKSFQTCCSSSYLRQINCFRTAYLCGNLKKGKGRVEELHVCFILKSLYSLKSHKLFVYGLRFALTFLFKINLLGNVMRTAKTVFFVPNRI